MTTRMQLLVLCFTLAVAAGGLFLPVPRRPAGPRLWLFVASGCEPLVRDLARDFNRGSPHGLFIHPAPAPALARRLRHGLRPDVLVATDGPEVGRVAADGLLDARRSVPLLEVSLVIALPGRRAAAHDSVWTLRGPGVRTIAVGTLETELGRATRAALRSVGLWYSLLPRFRPCRSGALALARVRQGEADAAIVFDADLTGEGGLRIVRDAFPAGSHEAVRFHATLVRHGPHPEAGEAFLAYLKSDRARQRIQAFARGERRAGAGDARGRVWGPLLLSLRAACLALMVVLPVAIGTAVFLARPASPVRNGVAALVDVPLVIPPSAVGCALLLLFGRGGPIERLGVPLSHTWQAGALAAAIMSLPLAVRPIRTAVAGLDPAYLKVARTLGVSRLSAYLLVVLPLGTRGVAAGMLLGFARAFGEFGATLVVAGNIPELTRTLPQAILTEIEAGDTSVAVTLLAVAAATALVATLGAVHFETGKRRA